MTRVIVTGDWHLDAVTAGVERSEELTASAWAVARYAIGDPRREVIRTPTVFLFVGDLTNPDDKRCFRAMATACQIARALSHHDIPSIWLTGNHDVVEDGYRSHTLMCLQGIEDCYVVDAPMWITVEGLTIWCLPYTARTHNYNPATVIKGWDSVPHLVAGHLMIEGIQPGSETQDFARGRDVFLPLEEITRVAPRARIVNGHYHQGQKYRGVYVPGSLGRLTVAEAGNNPRFLELDIPPC